MRYYWDKNQALRDWSLTVLDTGEVFGLEDSHSRFKVVSEDGMEGRVVEA